MTGMRADKAMLKELLEKEEWRKLPENLSAVPTGKLLGPLLSFLCRGGTLASRAAAAIGMITAHAARENPEEARMILRRLMWHMNEESGNLGWGIPESMAEICARNSLLAGEFQHILLSYVTDTGGEDNYTEHAPLRRGCWWAIGKLLQSGAGGEDFKKRAVPLLLNGLHDEDPACRDTAAWALAQAGTPVPAEKE